MSFIESPRFPTDIAYGSSGGPSFSTVVVVSDSGAEARNQNWAEARHKYDAAGGLKNPRTLQKLIEFFRLAKGRANGFRFKDWADYACYNGQAPSTYRGADGTGILTSLGGASYQMYKRYGANAGDPDRVIQKPVANKTFIYQGTVLLTAGVNYTIDTTTGIVTAMGGATPNFWRGEFDVPCRFDSDEMSINLENRSAYRWAQVPIVELRL